MGWAEPEGGLPAISICPRSRPPAP